MIAVSSSQLQQLKAVYGSRVPKENAAQMLEQSPAAPVSKAEKAALLEAAKACAGQELDEIKAAGDAVAHSRSVGTGQRGMPGSLAVQLQQMTGVDPAPQAQGLDKVITPERAQALFDQIANDPDIPHKFVHDGCHFRSTMSAKTLEDEGVFSEKIVINAERGDLKINSDHAETGFTLAMFHMATAIWVDGGEGPERKVIDPSLGDKPLSIEEWSSHMDTYLEGGGFDVYFLPRFCPHPTQRDNPPAAWDDKELADAKSWSKDYKEFAAELGKMNFNDSLLEMDRENAAHFEKEAAEKAQAAAGADDRAQEADEGEIVVEED